MKTIKLLQSSWALIFLYIPAILTLEIVSISSALSNQHSCVAHCLYFHDGLGNDMGAAMKCDWYYANGCYCATAAASASVASSWITACASTSCYAGDFDYDLMAMKSLYASYCMGAGYTQPGATNWYTAAAVTTSAQSGPTRTSGSFVTTTQVLIVTQTAPGSSNSGTAQSQGRYLRLLVIVPMVLLQVL
jgi:hypothetical protein